MTLNWHQFRFVDGINNFNVFITAQNSLTRDPIKNFSLGHVEDLCFVPSCRWANVEDLCFIPSCRRANAEDLCFSPSCRFVTQICIILLD